MVSGYLAETVALAAFSADGGLIEHQRVASDMPAFQAGPAHAGPNPLDNQVAFKQEQSISYPQKL